MKVVFVVAILLVGSLFYLTSCKTTQKVLSQQEVENLPKILEFSKSGCRGKCPVFDLTVYQDGWVVFDGRNFTKHEGKATVQLTKEEFATLQSNCEKADIWKCQPEYGMNIMDIPTTTIQLHEKDRKKKVRWRMRAPESLPTLSNEIMEIVYARNWVERGTVSKDKGIRMPAGAIDNELIIQFKNKIEAREWCKRFERFGMNVKKSLSTMTPIYLVEFDTGKMSPDKMLEMVKNDEEVATAEFNKRLKGGRR